MMQNFLRYLLLAALLVVGVFMLWYFRFIFFYIGISAVLSLVARPLFDLFMRIKFKWFHLSNGFAALFTMVIIWTLIILFFRFTIPLIGGELHYLSTVDIPQVIDRVSQMLFDALEPFRKNNAAIVSGLETQIKEAAVTLFDVVYIKDTFSGLVGFFGGLFVAAFSITFMTFFFLKEEGLLLGLLMIFIPDGYEAGLRHVLQSVKYLLRRYFIGILVQTFLICMLVTIGFMILGLEFNHAITIGLVSGLLNVIPYVGPLIGAFFGCITGTIIYLQVPPEIAFLSYLAYMGLVYAVVQLLDNIVFQPVIFSSSVKAHPLEIFLVIMMAGYMSGILGMFLAIPVYTIIRVVAREFFYNYRVVKKFTDGFRYGNSTPSL